MSELLQLVVDGLGVGCLYGLIGLALVQVYRSAGIVNFAQGEMATLAAYLAWQLSGWGIPIWLAITTSVALSFGFGMVIQRVVVSPLGEADHLSLVILTLGMFLAINAMTGFIWTYAVHVFPDPFPTASLTLGSVAISAQSLGSIGVLVVLGAMLIVLFQRSKLGLGMRAAISNPQSARLCGISVGMVQMIGWGLAAAIGALAGSLIAARLFLDPNLMLGVLTYAFAAATLGGIESPAGAIIGGLFIGVTENLAGAYIGLVGNDLKIAVPLVCIFVVLLVRPRGLFGARRVERV